MSLFDVRVLRSWNEVGEAIYDLDYRQYRLHRNPIKTWDLRLIRELAEDVDRRAPVLDLGCSTLGPVRLFLEMGFSDIQGCDLTISRFDRLIQLRDWLGSSRRNKFRRPYRLSSADLLDTGWPERAVELITCLSVIEHAVDPERFFGEAARMLRPGGRLYVSTDYWEPRLDTDGRKMYGVDWHVFCAEEILGLIEIARRHGLSLEQPTNEALRCSDPVVRDGAHGYTFVALRFERSG